MIMANVNLFMTNLSIESLTMLPLIETEQANKDRSVSVGASRDRDRLRERGAPRLYALDRRGAGQARDPLSSLISSHV
jgi:hypothetical protein